MPEYYLTHTKKEELEAELLERKSVTRPEILEKLEAARALGDLKENAEYHAMRDAQGRNESRIREIEELLKFVVVIEKSDDGTIDLASSVEVQKEGDTEAKVFMIVSPSEANIAEGKIGSDSALGKALMGKKVGDTAELITPKGSIFYSIKSVS